MDEIRITPEDITLKDIGQDDIFVFGSNEAGIHGAGAAYFALSLGAEFGQGFGLMGNTFAIPTKDWNIQQLPLSAIIFYVHRFIEFAIVNKDFRFYVTKIGCGLAGYTPEQIAPMFKTASNIDNIYLPSEFWDIINKQ